jgi:hypothetical protein
MSSMATTSVSCVKHGFEIELHASVWCHALAIRHLTSRFNNKGRLHHYRLVTIISSRANLTTTVHRNWLPVPQPLRTL